MVKLVYSEESAEMLNVIEEIDRIPVNLAILQKSECGKIMRKVAKYDTEDFLAVGLRAKEVVDKWKKIVVEASEVETTEETTVESTETTTEETVNETAGETVIKTNEKYSACEICGKELNVKSMKRHKRNVHGPSIDVDNSLSPPTKKLRRRGF